MTTTRHATSGLSRNATIVKVNRWVDTNWPRAVRWFDAQSTRTQIAVVVAAIFVSAMLLNVIASGFGRATTTTTSAPLPAIATSTAAPLLTLEAAPANARPEWVVGKVWQGAGSRDTESFAVSEHWRVDWLFNATQPGATFQVFIASADGRLLNIAGYTQTSGSSTTFWSGAGTYILKVSAVGGDWKLDVQNLR